MNIKTLKPFIPAQRLLFPRAGLDNKQFALVHYSENSSFFEAYRYMRINRSYIRYLLIPKSRRPIVRLTPALKKVIINHKLTPVGVDLGGYEEFTDHNYYLDMNIIVNAAESKWKFEQYHTGRAVKFMSSMIDTANSIPKDTHSRILLFTVNSNKPIQEKLFFKKAYSFYRKLEIGEFPFDYWLMFIFNENEGRYVKLYDKDIKIPLPRIRNYLMKLKPDAPSIFSQEEDDKVAEDVAKHASKNKDEIKAAVLDYTSVDSTLRDKSANTKQKATDVAAKSVVYQITGRDIDKTNEIMKSTSNEEKQRIINTYAKELLTHEPARIYTDDKVIRMANIPKRIENYVPTHIMNKRHKDFDENLKEDLENIFKTLETKQIPLTVTNVKKKIERTPVSELLPTLKDRYEIELKDPDGKKSKVYVDLPHLTSNGTFLINGRQRVLVNQLITYPIFFFKPYYGQLTTVYSAITIHSKQIKRGAYLMGFMGGYKVPLIMLVAYKIGYERILDMFDISYRIENEKPKDTDDIVIRLKDKSWLVYSSTTEEGIQLIRGLEYALNHWSGSINRDTFQSEDFWRKLMVSFTGTRNSVYIVDEVWKNIITPIEKEVLKSHGDPTELPGIIHFISKEVVNGKVDDRNALEKQRVRTSEVFTALILKQINAAYNEYLAKKLGGDEDAEIQLNPTRAFSEVITSQNVQLLENINPVEEISMMTRVTPIGVGGIPDKRAITNVAMNIHNSYYGNIDPLETPGGGPTVGILQHLTVDAALTNKRGQFGIKDPSKVHGGEILSSTPSLIPFVESCEGARVVMAAGQMKQAVPLLNPEPAAITTGYDSALVPLLSSDFVKKTTKGGVIQEIEKGYIKIKSSDGTIETIEMRPKLLKSGQGQNGISVFTPTVKVGQKVSPGQVLAEGSSVKDGQIATGVHILVALMPWKGYNFEDAVVISESAANKFTSVHLEEAKVYIQEDEDVVFIADEGDEMKKGGIALTYTSAVYDVESYRHLRLDGGRILNIEIYANTKEIPEKLNPAYKRFKNRFVALNNKYPQGAFKEKGEKFEGIMIKFVIRREAHLMKGDKLNNRHFNKGVIAIIEPDSNMPRTEWGETVDLILNPLSIINRMNSSQVAEIYCGLISWKLAQLMQEKTRSQFMTTYKKVATLLDGTEGKEMSKTMIQKMMSVSDKAYESLVNDVSRKRFFPIIVPPFKTPDRKNILTALEYLGVEARSKLDIPGFGKSKEKVTVGYIYETKLEHMSEKKLATRSVGGYVSKTMAPTQGKKREGGQKIGEHDMYSLLSWDCPVLIEEFFGALSSDHVTKNEIISEIIHTGRGEFKFAKSNPVKDLYSQMMLAIHLQSE